MKQSLGFLAFALALSFSGCKKDSGSNTSSTANPPAVTGSVTVQVTVLKDCSGVFLRYNGKYYRVCSLSQFRDYADGATVKATFTIVDKCGELDIFCSAAKYTRTAWADVTAIE